MSNQMNDTIKELDKEWVELIKLAKEIQISKEEIRKFLSENSV